MTEWLIRLRGKKSDLVYLCTLSLSYGRVVEEDGGFSLRSIHFDSLTDVNDVFQRATNFLDVINGAAKLRYPNLQAVRANGVTRIEEDGKRTQVIMVPGIESEAGVGILTVVSDDSTSSKQPSIPELWVEIAEKDTSVDKALLLYGNLEHNWRNLYMVLEVVEEDVGGKKALINKDWVSGNKIKLFKRTANSYHSLGPDARHSTNREPPPNPMSIQEARSLIRNILLKWLPSKY